MMSDKWHHRFLELAETVSRWSKDPSTKVGAVLVNPKNKAVVSTGFNGFPSGHVDSADLYSNREYKYKHIIHAEVNALKLLDYTPAGFLLYTTFHPCRNCVEEIATSGVTTVVCPQYDAQKRPDWAERIAESKQLATSLGVTIVEL